jgi:alpha-beta hydrolase superfamily lysophospholipase
MTDIAASGLAAYGLDFPGFGASSMRSALDGEVRNGPPLMRAPDAARAIAAAVDYLQGVRGIKELHIVAHSWGTLPAALFASTNSQSVASLTLFGPIVAGPEPQSVSRQGGWWEITAPERYEQLRYRQLLPPNVDLLEPAIHARWQSDFEESARTGGHFHEGSVRIPAGPVVDIAEAHLGIYPYVREHLHLPILLVHGNYDNQVDHNGAQTFLRGCRNAPLRWHLEIDGGTHVLHLEHNRHSLYAAVAAFIGTVSGSHYDFARAC